MHKNSKIGKEGELLAQKYLLSKNYEIIFSNWRYKRSEVDLIAKDNNMIVFIEVKTRTNLTFGYPENFVTPNKIKKLQEAADAYIELFNWEGELRFDIISIDGNNVIEHFEDAFY